MKNRGESLSLFGEISFSFFAYGHLLEVLDFSFSPVNELKVGVSGPFEPVGSDLGLEYHAHSASRLRAMKIALLRGEQFA